LPGPLRQQRYGQEWKEKHLNRSLHVENTSRSQSIAFSPRVEALQSVGIAEDGQSLPLPGQLALWTFPSRAGLR